MSTIAQVANFVAPHSGGIRTVLAELAGGYGAAGHEVVQVVPGAARATEQHTWGRREVLLGVAVGGTGYRMLRPAQVRHVLDECVPDRVEVHDRTTLRGLCRWARKAGVRSTVVSHERVDRLLAQRIPSSAARAAADVSNRRLSQGYDSVVCTTEWAADEFQRIGADNLRLVPLGADLDLFTPSARDETLRARMVKDGELLLVLASRLSPEKRPDLAIAALSVLVHHGVLARLAIAGDGPLRARLTYQAKGLPVVFLGHLSERADVARLFASADIVLAPGAVETFGLSAVEALGCGTPVVVNANSALPSVIGDAGIAAAGSGMAFAAAVQRLLQRAPQQRHSAARERAERYRWPDTVRGFLDVHDLTRMPIAS